MKKWFGIVAIAFLLSSSFIGNAAASEKEGVKPRLFNLQEDDLLEGEGDYKPYLELEPNNSFEEANEILSSVEVKGSVPYQDEDYFKIEVTEKSYFGIAGYSEDFSSNVKAQLYDAKFNPIFPNVDLTQDNYFLKEVVLNYPGTYYIKINDYTMTSTSAPVDYTFSVLVSPAHVDRLGGANRYETAVQVAAEGFPFAEEIILATGEDFPDALAAGPLAVHRHAPILLTTKDELPASVKEYITNSGITRVTIIGGTGVVSQGIQDYLRKTLRLEVSRIAGQDRFETAANVALSVNPGNEYFAFVVNGRNFPDALSAAPIAAALGAPILLTEAKTMPEATANAVRQYPINFVVGGSGVVSDTIVQSLSATRIGGLNRYETSVAVADYFEMYNSHGAFVTTGEAFPDALSASALAGLYGQPIILTTPNSLHYIANRYFQANKHLLAWYTIVGGTGAVSNTIEQNLWSFIK